MSDYDAPDRERSVCPDCGNGWTFDFLQRRVYCRTCEEATSADAVDPADGSTPDGPRA